MNDRFNRRQYLVFLAVVACLSMSFQTAGHLSFTEASPGTLRCVEAFWVTSSTLQTDTAGEGPSFNEYSSGESLFLVPGLPGTALTQQGRILATARTSLSEGFPAEIYRPPIAAV